MLDYSKKKVFTDERVPAFDGIYNKGRRKEEWKEKGKGKGGPIIK